MLQNKIQQYNLTSIAKCVFWRANDLKTDSFVSKTIACAIIICNNIITNEYKLAIKQI